MENTSQGLVPFALPYTPAKHIKTIAVSTTYFNLSNQFAHSSEIRSGFFLIFLKMYRYKACTASPNVPNAQANPQKNLPNQNKYCHKRCELNPPSCSNLCKYVFHSGKCCCIYRRNENKIQKLNRSP